MFNISWNNHVEDVTSLEVVESLLDKIHRESFGDAAQLAIVERQIDGNSLTIGLGSDTSVLS